MANLGFKTDLNRFWTNSVSSFAPIPPFLCVVPLVILDAKSALEYFTFHCVLTYLDRSQPYFYSRICIRSLNTRIESRENCAPAQNRKRLGRGGDRKLRSQTPPQPPRASRSLRSLTLTNWRQFFMHLSCYWSWISSSHCQSNCGSTRR